jgi:hypothetical protein
MGWDLILEYMIGVASVSNALSKYIDFLTGNRIEKALKAAMPMNQPGLGPYPDFFAFFLVVIVTCNYTIEIFFIISIIINSVINY